MNDVSFTSTRLANSNKKGIIRPDSDGYYSIVVGGLNAFNSAGEYYTLEGAIDLFKESSILMRRLEKGVVKSELGHPQMLPGMTEEQYIHRLLTIDEKNVSSHFRKFTLDKDFGRKNPQFKNPNLVAIIALLKPTGPHGPSLEAAFNNPHQNVCFSIRGLTENYYKNGKTMRLLTNIVTFDEVTEQGINIANKYDSPSLESYDYALSKRRIELALGQVTRTATEDSKALAASILLDMRKSIVTLPTIPIHYEW